MSGKRRRKKLKDRRQGVINGLEGFENESVEVRGRERQGGKMMGRKDEYGPDKG